MWEERATAAGLVPERSVTKRTRLVVAADPDTLSSKARKARAYRIPIVDAATFPQPPLASHVPDVAAGDALVEKNQMILHAAYSGRS